MSLSTPLTPRLVQVGAGIDPIASSVFTTRAGAWTRILSLSALITTSADAGDRYFAVLAVTPADSRVLGFWTTGSQIAAAQSTTIVWMLHYERYAGSGTYLASSIPSHLLPPDTIVRVISYSFSHASDRIGALNLVIEEFEEKAAR